MAGLIGILIGLVLGLTGAGGSVLAVPMLKWGLGLPTSEAMGLSLGAVAAAAAYGSFIRLKQNSIVWMPAGVLIVSGVLGSPLGSWLRMRAPELWLDIGFSILVVIVAVGMWRQAKSDPSSTKVLRAEPDVAPGADPACDLSPSGQFELKPRCVGRMASIGIALGILSGLFGVGGGFVIVPGLMLFTGLNAARAVATSLIVITAVSSFSFALFVWQRPTFNWYQFVPVAVGGLLGMFSGSLIGRFIAGPKLQQVFVILMLLMAALMLLKT